MQELIVIPEEKTQLLNVFIEARDFAPEIERIRDLAKDLPLDMAVKKNRDEVASFAYKVAKSKTAIEKAGAALSAEYKEIPKKIDATRRAYKQAFESLQVEVRQPLTEWEEKEKALEDFLTSEVEALKTLASASSNDHGASDLVAMLEQLEAYVIGDNFYDFETEALRVKAAGLISLKEQIAIAEKREADKAELERLRQQAAAQAQKDREAQIARDAAQAEREKNERERIAAQEQAEQARRDLEQAEQRRIAQENQAKQDAIEAEKRAAELVEAARLTEIERQETIARNKAAQQAQREADKDHRAAINRAALSALVSHAELSDDQAKRVVTCIAKGLIKNVTVNY